MTRVLLDQWLHRAIRAALAAPRISHAGSPGDLGLKFEVLRIATANQRSLHAWLVAPPDSSVPPHPAAIVIHGWGGNSAMMLPLARPLHEAVELRVVDGGHDAFADLPENLELLRTFLQDRLTGVRATARTGTAAGLASSESNAVAGGAAARQRRSK